MPYALHPFCKNRLDSRPILGSPLVISVELFCSLCEEYDQFSSFQCFVGYSLAIPYAGRDPEATAWVSLTVLAASGLGLLGSAR